MESVKKWLTERTAKKNGIYVHYSPPKVVGVVSAAQIRQLARDGPDGKLERLVLAGQGRRLLAEAEALPLSHHLPALVAKCDALHAAVEKGSLMELQNLLESDYNRRKFVMCLDEAGVGLLHKAVYYDFMDIAEYLVSSYPQLVHMKDSLGRTPLHYTALCRDAAGAASMLEGAGAARAARDASGRPPAHYRGTARALLALPTTEEMTKNPTGLVIKGHTIRIWCHDCDMARLQRVVWEGHGSRLLSEVSSQPVVRKFLEAVPYIMNTIRDIHSAVVENDLEGLMKHSGDPVPPQALSSRDTNNMTVMHKAAGLGHSSIMKYVAERYPQGVNDIDNDGRTPLHYAAAVRDDKHTYKTLIGLGADESIVDNKNKTAAFYNNRPQDIDKNLFKVLPDAPRTPSSAYPASWDWKLLDTEVIAELNKKSKRRHLRASNENVSSKTNTVSESTENRTSAMKASSTHELIKDLPELDEKKPANDSDETKEKLKENDATKESVDVEDYSQDEENSQDDENSQDEEISQNEENPQDEDLKTNEETGENEDETEVVQNIGDADDAPEALNDIKEGENGSNFDDNPKLSEESATGKNKDETKDQEENAPEYEDEVDDEATKDDVENNDQETHIKENEVHKSLSNIHESDKPNDDTPKEKTEDNVNELYNYRDDDQISNHEDTYNNDNSKIEGHQSTKYEGNNNSSDNSADDDDVQVPGDNQSEYSDTNLKSTAEISGLRSANIGSQNNGRNTQESLIEGIVNGEVEQDSQDASLTQKADAFHGEVLVLDNEIDSEVTDLINTANMEMLATLVLNGEGSRLIGRRSGNTELQGFLDNVELYMNKINMVHEAAKEGNIPDMQAALDRRKFAIARDPISPNGATPMHVATVFGKTNVIKYLGSKFPETLSAVDFEGRTALHYAAVLPDNGHYYNLLQQLGANSKDLDDNGRSAEDYRKDQSLLSFDQMLADFGISDEAAQIMFSDKGPSDPDAGHMDIPIFRTEEGRYLAQSLGDPLIKGLTEVANVKPKDPVAFLASFLHNFPENEKPQIGTQETNVLLTQEAPEVENEAPVPIEAPRLPRSATRTATRPHKPIDVVTLDPHPLPSPDGPEIAFSSAKRDEHGQSMLHFAAARTHTRNALFQLLQESDVSIGYRDELYRTARDVSTQANVPDNTTEIDRYVLHLAARGNTEKIAELIVEGYDHILDVTDEEGATIADVISERGDAEMVKILASIPPFEEKRDVLHNAVRQGDLSAVERALASEGGRKLICSQNSFSRTALHIAVLAQHEDIVSFLAQNVPELLRIGDNLERTPLHYAMGVEKIESLSRVLIRAGSKRVLKDLKGRQPSYYFMNKSEILRLQEEEEIY